MTASPVAGGDLAALPAGWQYVSSSPFGSRGPVRIASVPHGFLGVGGDASSTWTLSSSDGVSWDRGPSLSAAVPDRFSGAGYTILASGPSAHLLVPTGGPGVEGASTAYWRSSDGLAWEQPAEGLPPDERVFELVGAPDGFYAITWSDLVYRDSRGGTLWRSVDGDGWSQVAVEDAFSDYLMTGVVASGRSVLVRGVMKVLGGEGSVRAWVTTDLRRWTTSREHAAHLQTEGTAHPIVPTRDGFGVYGNPDGRLALFTTTDGATWQPHEVTGLSPDAATGLVVVGRGGLLMNGGWYDDSVVRNGVLGATFPLLSVSRDGTTWFGTEAMRPVLEPPRGNLWLYDSMLSGDRMVLTVGAWGDLTRDCAGGECPTVLIAGPVPEP